MASHAIADTSLSARSLQQPRIRALVVPREHGAWGLLLVPLFSGAAVGVASTGRAWPVILFTVAALALFWLRTPVESLMGRTPLSAHTLAERRASLLVSAGLGAVSAACLAALLWHGRNRDLLLLGGIAVLAFVAQTLLVKLSRNLRMMAQMIGAIGLTCTAPAAYYVATGRLDARAWVLWSANWIFAGDQIHFVQLRIHAARAATLGEKLRRGRLFFVGQILLLPILAAAAYWRLMPALVMIAFIPGLLRGFYWFFGEQKPLRVKSLGWSEMRQGVLFGILLAAAMILS
ncbi:MAG: YwiC-like family protein [Candidatus Acidiferrales bacterium]